MDWMSNENAAWVSAFAAVIQAVGAVAAIVYTGKLAREGVEREKAATEAADKRSKLAEEAATARAELAERRLADREEKVAAAERGSVIDAAQVFIDRVIEPLEIDARYGDELAATGATMGAFWSFSPPPAIRQGLKALHPRAETTGLLAVLLRIDEDLDPFNMTQLPVQLAETKHSKLKLWRSWRARLDEYR